jgi:hypothetical protein
MYFIIGGADGQFKILDYRKQLARVGLINTMAEDPTKGKHLVMEVWTLFVTIGDFNNLIPC